MKRRLIVALCPLLVAASCGESNIDAIERLRPRGAEMRARLARLSRLLPAEPLGQSRVSPAAAFEPPLAIDFKQKRFSADVLMEEQLRDPDADIGNRLDLLLSHDLLPCLMWTGPRNPLEKSVWDNRSELGRDCERAFAARWLVVVRTTRYELPERVALDVFVLDVARETVVASFPIDIQGRYRRADLGAPEVAGQTLRQLRSDAFVVARCEVARRLSALPGANVDIRKSWLTLDGPDPCESATKSTFWPVASRPLEAARDP